DRATWLRPQQQGLRRPGKGCTRPAGVILENCHVTAVIVSSGVAAVDPDRRPDRPSRRGPRATGGRRGPDGRRGTVRRVAVAESGPTTWRPIDRRGRQHVAPVRVLHGRHGRWTVEDHRRWSDVEAGDRRPDQLLV